MSTPDRTARIQHAAQLIKQGDKPRAYDILRTAIQEDPSDWRGWWGLVHASSNAKERAIALQKTVQLNPGHEKAAAMLRELKSAGAKPPAQPDGSSRLLRSAGAAAAAAEPPALRTSQIPPLQTSEIAAWENPFDGPASNAQEAAPWENPFDAPAQYDSAAQQTNPWDDNPFEKPLYDEPEALYNPFDSPLYNEPATPESSALRYALPSEVSAARKPTSRSGSSGLINALIVIVGILVVVGIIIAVFAASGTSLDGIGNSIASFFNGGAPNSLNGGDPWRTVGGGYVQVGGSAQGNLGSLRDAHNWVFEGIQGQTVTISVTGYGATDPQFKLLDQHNNILAADDDSGRSYGLGMWDAMVVYQGLPYTGAYTIRVDVYEPGNYAVNVYDGGL